MTDGDFEVNLVRLLLASVKGQGQLSINVEDYLSPELDTKGLIIEANEEEKTFVLKLAEYGDIDEPRHDGETSTPNSEE